MSTQRVLGSIAAFSLLHFAIAMAVAVATYGTDLDQLRSRSAFSRAAGVVYDILWYPHDSLIRAIPNPALTRPGVIPSVLIGASVLWGCTIWLVVTLVKSGRRA